MLPEKVLQGLPPLRPEQDDLRPVVPTVYGSLEYRTWRQGLKVRMREPQEFLRALNRLSMEMAKNARRAGSRRARKATLRRMKRALKNGP